MRKELSFEPNILNIISEIIIKRNSIPFLFYEIKPKNSLVIFNNKWISFIGKFIKNLYIITRITKRINE